MSLSRISPARREEQREREISTSIIRKTIRSADTERGLFARRPGFPLTKEGRGKKRWLAPGFRWSVRAGAVPRN